MGTGEYLVGRVHQIIGNVIFKKRKLASTHNSSWKDSYPKIKGKSSSG
jgi:hypothetical protein